VVGHNDLNGLGDGGEGLALQQLPDGRRILYLAHEAPQRCLSVIDVTKPHSPRFATDLQARTAVRALEALDDRCVTAIAPTRRLTSTDNR